MCKPDSDGGGIACQADEIIKIHEAEGGEREFESTLFFQKSEKAQVEA